MDIETHYSEFQSIIKKYNLDDEFKAEEIANFLTSHKEKQISSNEFATLFGMDEKEAIIFLSFIQKGINFKRNV